MNIPAPYDSSTALTKMAEPLLDDPVYGLALSEASRVNRIGGLKYGEPLVDINVLTIALARMADEITKARKNQGIPPELADGLDEYGKHWRAPIGRTPDDRDSDRDRHAGEQLMSVWRRVKSGEIPRPFDVQHPAYLKVIREREEARNELLKVEERIRDQHRKSSIIPPESPKPDADKRTDSAELLKLAGSVVGLAGLERSGYGLRAGDRGVSLHKLAADAIGYAQYRLVETGENGVRDALILLGQIRHELMCERQAAKPLRFFDRMYEARMRIPLEPLDTGSPPIEALAYTMDHFEAAARDRVGSMLGLGNKPMWTKVADALRTARTELAQQIANGIQPCRARWNPGLISGETEKKPCVLPAGHDGEHATDLRAAAKQQSFTPATTVPGPGQSSGVPMTEWDTQWERAKGYKDLPSVPKAEPPQSVTTPAYPEIFATLKPLFDAMLAPLHKSAAELQARLDEELRQRAPVPHAELDLKTGADPIAVARHTLEVRACGFANRLSRPMPVDAEKARAGLQASSLALAVAVLASLQYKPADAPTYEACQRAIGYKDALDTLERFRARAETDAK